MASLGNGQAVRTSGAPISTKVELAPEVDRVILFLYLTFVFLGIVMVASASFGIADQQTNDPFFYAKTPVSTARC